MDFDLILQHVGEFGKYQKLLYALIFLSTIHLGSIMMTIIFNSIEPDFRCHIDECDNSNSIYNAKWMLNFNESQLGSLQCKYPNFINSECAQLDISFDNNFTQCQKWIFDNSLYQLTIVSEWDLVCDRSWLNTLSSSVWMIGLTIGSLVFGYISDNFGRKFALTNAAVLNCIICFAIPFSINYLMFLVLKFFQAIVCIGFFDIATVIALEFIGPSKRVLCGMGTATGFCIGAIILGGLSYLIPHWRKLHFFLAIPSLIFLSFYWVVPESVRWLLLHKKHDQAIDIISKMALTNRVALPDKILYCEIGDNKITKNNVSSSITQLFSNRVVRWRTINILIMWYLTAFGYYGISLNTVNLEGNTLINFILASLIELPALTFCIFILDRFGRKIPLISLLVIGGFFCIATTVLPKDEYTYWFTIAFFLVAKFGVSSAYAVIILFTVELLPTSVRNSGLGLTSFFANAGAMIAPYVSSLGSNIKELPLLVFGIALVVSGFFVFTLPETVGKVLPETIEDAKKFGLKEKNLGRPKIYTISVKRRKSGAV